MKYIPVVSNDGKTLMPTAPSRARRFIKDKKATPFYNLGIFCIRMNKEVQQNLQPICLAVDPGSKREAYTIRSKANHYLNIQSNAIDWVKDRMQARLEMRRGRRYRNTPCRPPRFLNRSSAKNRLAPSTKARWQLKLNITKKLLKIFPISVFRIEDIKATSKEGKKRWNQSFSPLQTGKKWFKKEIQLLGLKFRQNPGYETSKLRKHYKLLKTKNKLSETFNAHVVDTAVMAANELGAKKADQNTDILFISPIALVRRQLHKRQYAKGNKRKRDGGFRNVKVGLTKGSIVKILKPTKATLKANKAGFFLLGGYDDRKENIKLTICSLDNQSNRVSRTISVKNIKFIAYNKYTLKN